MKKRWVRKDRRIYNFSTCKLCGVAYGTGENHQCPPSTCLACGSRQCLYNGLGRGQCSICFYGLLPGWAGNDRKCSYKGCDKDAVARGRGNKPVCKDHLLRQKPDFEKQWQENLKAWQEVEELI